MSNKPGVTGIGGVFFKAQKPENLRRWYETHLGLTPMDAYGHNFRWNEPDTGREALTVWSPFSAETKYFEPSTKPYMVNFRVRHLDELLAQLRAAGVTVDDKMRLREGTWDGGRARREIFAWATDDETDLAKAARRKAARGSTSPTPKKKVAVKKVAAKKKVAVKAKKKAQPEMQLKAPK